MHIWQPSDALRLRQLRLENGLDPSAIAQRCAISLRQLQELEGQGEGSFYSEAIKWQVGAKVLRALGDKSAGLNAPSISARKLFTKVGPSMLDFHVVPPAENQRLLYSIGASLTTAGALMSGVNALDGLGLRPGGVLVCLIGLAMMLACRHHRNTWAVMLMCWGILVATLASAFVARGLFHVSWVALPMAIMAAGWFMGRVAAWSIAAVSVTGALAFYALHRHEFPFPTEIPLETVLAALIACCAIAAFIASSISETFGRQFELINESRAELRAVMDSTRSMIWSVGAGDFGLRVFNRVFEQEIADHVGIQPAQGQLPHEVFSRVEQCQRWCDAYNKVVELGGMAWEEDLFDDGRRFEISCQAIREANKVIGLAIHARALPEAR